MVGGGRSTCLGEPCAQTGRPETTPSSEAKTEPPSAPAGPATRLMAADQATWAKQQRCAGLSWPPRQDFAERVPEMERRHPHAGRPLFAKPQSALATRVPRLKGGIAGASAPSPARMSQLPKR